MLYQNKFPHNLIKSPTKQRGQVFVLFALMIPVILLFVGLAFDLGWYYFNVSRLQNAADAADAAALAGAKSLIQSDSTFSHYKNPWLVSSYSGNESDIDLTEAKQASLSYTSKNLAESQSTGTVTASEIVNDNKTNSEVAHVETLYQDAENDDVYYYVVRLAENVEHFFLPGWFDEMSAPVVAVAKLSRTGSEDDDDGGDGGSDGGDGGSSGDNPIDPDNPPTPPNIEDVTGDEAPDDSDDSDDSTNPNQPTTEEEQHQQEVQQQEEGFSIYGAMKGNTNYNRKGLEELMTYRTWWSIYSPTDNSNLYGVYPEEGGSIYFTDKNYRTETTNITSSEVSSKKNNFTLFLDLGSDLMYVDHHSGRNNQGGLFEYSWDVSDIPSDGGDTLTSIINHAYANRLSGTNASNGNYELTFNFKIAKTTTGRGKTTTSYSKVSYSEGQTGIKYRVHTSFN
ncbi:MAG: pilus assembly protein, partial [Selenomonadaceae bacterium]|nr:pilus assembly protein [Selenomonadaceae bacterium]